MTPWKTGLFLAIFLIFSTFVAAQEPPPPLSAAYPQAGPSVGTGAARPPNDGLAYGLTAGAFSNYVRRGVVVNDRAVFQGDAWARYKGLRFDSWHNVGLTDAQAGAGRVTESDWTASYGFDFSRLLSLQLGYIYYAYPNARAEDTQEVFASATLDMLLHPSVATYRDIDTFHGTYTMFAVHEEVPIGFDDLDAKVCAKVGVADARYFAAHFGSDSGGGFVGFTLGAGVPIKMTNHVSLIPSLALVNVLDNRAQEASGRERSATLGLSTQFTW